MCLSANSQLTDGHQMANGQLADGQLDFFIDLFFTIEQNFDNFADLLAECNKVSNTTGAANLHPCNIA